MIHLKVHNISPEEYFLTYIKSEIPICPICGEVCKFNSLSKGYYSTCPEFMTAVIINLFLLNRIKITIY